MGISRAGEGTDGVLSAWCRGESLLLDTLAVMSRDCPCRGLLHSGRLGLSRLLGQPANGRPSREPADFIWRRRQGGGRV